MQSLKFNFEITDKGKLRRGTLDAVDREQALANLEAKGFRVEKLSLAGDHPPAFSSGGKASLALCAIGLLAGCWSALFGWRTLELAPGRKVVSLEISGSLEGDLSEVDKVTVLFPEVPFRIESAWSELAVGGEGRAYTLKRQIQTTENPPLYFHLKVTDSQGKVLAERSQVPFNGDSGRGDAGVVTVRTR